MSSNGVHHAADEQIDSLYSFWPGLAPAPAPLPEAAFSLTLKGRMAGVDALLTVRGATPAEFQRNLEAVRGLLDAPTQAVQASNGKGWCQKHGVQMQEQHKDGRTWRSHRLENGSWCKGK
jgi:hypothetical protein